MAVNLGALAGVSNDVLPSPVATSSSRSGPQQPKSEEKREAPAATDDLEVSLQETHPGEKAYLASMLERAPNIGAGDKATFYFERDPLDGNMYLYVKDKRTGEQLYRIPKQYLTEIGPHSRTRHRLDIRI